jgi:hypothetical protein
MKTKVIIKGLIVLVCMALTAADAAKRKKKSATPKKTGVVACIHTNFDPEKLEGIVLFCEMKDAAFCEIFTGGTFVGGSVRGANCAQLGFEPPREGSTLWSRPLPSAAEAEAASASLQ